MSREIFSRRMDANHALQTLQERKVGTIANLALQTLRDRKVGYICKLCIANLAGGCYCEPCRKKVGITANLTPYKVWNARFVMVRHLPFLYGLQWYLSSFSARFAMLPHLPFLKGLQVLCTIWRSKYCIIVLLLSEVSLLYIENKPVTWLEIPIKTWGSWKYCSDPYNY